MRECTSAQAGPSGASPRPLVYIRTLGTLMARVGGRVPPFKGNGAGRRQLRRQLGWLVGHCNRPVTWQSLREIAGGQERAVPLARPFYMVAGLVQMLHRWDMGAALLRGYRQMTLVTHSCWGTDTDELIALVDAAEERAHGGDTGAALALLERAAAHCGDRHGHRFLAELVDQLPPTHLLHAKASYWTGVQREALHRLTRLCLDTGERGRARQAMATSRQAMALDGCSRADFYLAAEAAEACGMAAVAKQHRRAGDQLPP